MSSVLLTDAQLRAHVAAPTLSDSAFERLVDIADSVLQARFPALFDTDDDGNYTASIAAYRAGMGALIVMTGYLADRQRPALMSENDGDYTVNYVPAAGLWTRSGAAALCAPYIQHDGGIIERQ